MIQALLHHKSHIGLIEDEKTSMIIGTLLHLPTTLMLEIISDAVEDKKKKPSTLKNKTKEHLQKMPEFWPHWPPKGTSNDHHVESDVFMLFKSFDLIIEVKRNDDKTSQYGSQLNNELIAYENEYGEENKEVYLIALGGNTDDIKSVDKKKRDKILTCSWNDLLYSIEKKKREIRVNREDYFDDVTYRILFDCINAFEVFGHTAGWLYELCDLKYKAINKESIEKIRLWKI